LYSDMSGLCISHVSLLLDPVFPINKQSQQNFTSARACITMPDHLIRTNL
jgi:hypothetical protein